MTSATLNIPVRDHVTQLRRSDQLWYKAGLIQTLLSKPLESKFPKYCHEAYSYSGWQRSIKTDNEKKWKLLGCKTFERREATTLIQQYKEDRNNIEDTNGKLTKFVSYNQTINTINILL